MTDDDEAALDERRSALLDLVQLRTPPADAIAALRRFPWDCEVELVLLSPADALRAIDAHLAGRLSAAELEAWADALEMRDDLGFAQQEDGLLRELVFSFANPYLTESIGREAAERWKARLANRGRDLA